MVNDVSLLHNIMCGQIVYCRGKQVPWVAERASRKKLYVKISNTTENLVNVPEVVPFRYVRGKFYYFLRELHGDTSSEVLN